VAVGVSNAATAARLRMTADGSLLLARDTAATAPPLLSGGASVSTRTTAARA
jgi:hypothetical protein